MDPNLYKRNELLAQKVIKGLNSRNMTGYYAADREEALKRLENTQRSTLDGQHPKQNDFVINDRVTYHSSNDFRALGNTERYRQLLDLQKRLDEYQQALEKSRNYYGKATVGERKQLAVEMQQMEQDLLRMNESMHALEKEIRNNENEILNQ